jgi:hypothetical protein
VIYNRKFLFCFVNGPYLTRDNDHRGARNIPSTTRNLQMNIVALLVLLLIDGGACALVPARAAAMRMSAGENPGWNNVVANARARAAALKSDQDATAGAVAIGAIAVYVLPTFSNGPFDLVFSTLVGGGLMGYVAGFQDDDAGKAVRSAGRAAATAFRQTAAAFEESGVIDKVSAAVKQKLQ